MSTDTKIPDWVVDIAVDAFLSNTGQAHRVTDLQRELTRECMAPALTAVMAAWMVPAFFATGGEGDFTLFAEFTDLDQAYAYAGDDGWVVEAYAIRNQGDGE